MESRTNAELIDWQGEWLPRAVISGFVATGVTTSVLVLAYVAAALLGTDSPQAPLLQRWLWGLANNVVTERVQTAVPLAVLLHVVAGIGWAIVYARLVEPRLPGAGWRKGLLFSPVPWILSLIVFLPAVGGGLFGLNLNAGPLPAIGNLVLHMIYGATIGQLHPASQVDRPLVERGEPVDPGEVRTLVRVERSMAVGIIAGLALGGLVGWIGSIVLVPGSSPLLAAMIGGLLGSAWGALLASFSGLSPAS